MGLRNLLFKYTGIRLKKYKYNNDLGLIELLQKKRDFDACKNIEILVLGSSHGAYSFNTSIINNSFNFCSSSQDLYYSLNIYKNTFYNQNRIPVEKYKKVLLYFSVFSYGFDLSKGKEKIKCAYMKKLFNIEPCYISNEIKYHIKELNKIDLNKVNLPTSSNGFTYHQYFFNDNYPALKRVTAHLKSRNRKPTFINYLIELIELCKKNKQELIIIIPPARSDYENLVTADVFDEVETLAKKQDIKVINLFKKNKFNDELFGDLDHMNLKGSAVFTTLIKKLI